MKRSLGRRSCAAPALSPSSASCPRRRAAATRFGRLHARKKSAKYSHEFEARARSRAVAAPEFRPTTPAAQTFRFSPPSLTLGIPGNVGHGADDRSR